MLNYFQRKQWQFSLVTSYNAFIEYNVQQLPIFHREQNCFSFIVHLISYFYNVVS